MPLIIFSSDVDDKPIVINSDDNIAVTKTFSPVVPDALICLTLEVNTAVVVVTTLLSLNKRNF